MLTARKARRVVRAENARKRGGGRRVHFDLAAFADVMVREPTPELAAQVVEECRRRLRGLADDNLRAAAVDKMEGYDNAEIAQRQGCTTSTIERKLAPIRDT